jgi:nicotinate dehydrogenase subunit B
MEGKPTLKPVTTYTVVGQSIPRPDAIEKVTGRAKFAGDIVTPAAALHARLLRPPAHGATLADVDTSAAEKVPGVRVVRDGDLIAVMHEHRDEADAALALVRARWTRNDPPVDDKTIFDHLVKAAPPGRNAAEGGSLDDGARISAEVVEHTWLDSYVAHAPIETHTATAAVENGKVTVWAGTQTPFPLWNQVASALKLPPEKVRIITPYRWGRVRRQVGVAAGGGGGTPRDADRQAGARGLEPRGGVLLRHVSSGGGDQDPVGHRRVKRIALWDYRVYAAGERGAAHFYDIPHHRTAVQGGWNQNTPGYHPFAIGPWRAPGANTNAFARESQIDVMAAKAGIDPVEFRLQNMTDPRMRRVLETVAKKFGWTPKAGPSGRGVGVACGIDADTYVALAAEVAWTRRPAMSRCCASRARRTWGSW